MKESIRESDKIMEEVIKSFEQYIRFLENECQDNEILFRGQREDWTLLPKIARVRLGPDSTFDKIIEQFKREACPYVNVGDLADWDLRVIAQHHGLPTPLLDWTKNPLAALWFAIREPARNEKRGVVWVYRYQPVHLVSSHQRHRDPRAAPPVEVLCPMHVTPRVVVQAGWFTVHPYDDGTVPTSLDESFEKLPEVLKHGFMADGGHVQRRPAGYVSLESSVPASCLVKLLIPPASFSSLRRHLARCGINESTLFPDLDGLCRHVAWLHTLLEDEIVEDSDDPDH